MNVNWEYIAWVAGLAGVSFLLSLVLVGGLAVGLPHTFFLSSHERRFWVDQHPMVRWTGLIVKNVVGGLLVLIGLLLSVPGVPGQGILTILIGLVLIDFPKKRKVERAIVAYPRVNRTVNRLRAGFGKPPFLLDPPDRTKSKPMR